jgi:hypothetical protein
MNKQQAYQFVHNLLDTIVVEADVSKLGDYYQTDAQLHIGDLNFELSDVENRMAYLKSTFIEREHHLYDVVVVDDVLVFQDQQRLKNKNTGEWDVKSLTGTYQLKDGKVQQAWLISNENIDYLKKC